MTSSGLNPATPREKPPTFAEARILAAEQGRADSAPTPLPEDAGVLEGIRVRKSARPAGHRKAAGRRAARPNRRRGIRRGGSGGRAERSSGPFGRGRCARGGRSLTARSAFLLRCNGGRPYTMTPAKLRLAQAAMTDRDTKVGDLCKELGVTRQPYTASSAARASYDPTA